MEFEKNPKKAKGTSPEILKTHDPQELAKLDWIPYPPGSLSGKQRTYLKGLAHHLTPVAQIGQEGVTGKVIGEIRKQLLSHELIKVKWLGLSKEEGNKKEQARELAQQVGAHYIHLIGQVVLLYRGLEPQYAGSEQSRKIQIPVQE